MQKMLTVIVAAARIQWGNDRERCVDSGNDIGIVILLGETLEFPRSERLDRTYTCGEMTLMALIQSARSSEVMALHSFRTLGEVQAALAEVNNRVERTAMRRRLRKAMSRI
jgi:hypothetical protein